MELRDLLNDAGDIDDDVLSPSPVPGLANLLKLMADEIYLGLLHTEINARTIVPANPQFKALPRAYPIRPFKLCLLAGFQASLLAFFKLFFTDDIFNILVRNTNLYAETKDARTARCGQGQQWKPINRHELLVWICCNPLTNLKY
jgi:Transposase IS4